MSFTYDFYDEFQEKVQERLGIVCKIKEPAYMFFSPCCNAWAVTGERYRKYYYGDFEERIKDRLGEKDE